MAAHMAGTSSRTRMGRPRDTGSLAEAWQKLTPQDVVRTDVGDPAAQLLAGHSARRIGAQWYTALGRPRWLVMLRRPVPVEDGLVAQLSL